MIQQASPVLFRWHLGSIREEIVHAKVLGLQALSLVFPLYIKVNHKADRFKEYKISHTSKERIKKLLERT